MFVNFAVVLESVLAIVAFFPWGHGASPPDPPVNICCLPWFWQVCQFFVVVLESMLAIVVFSLGAGAGTQTPMCTYAVCHKFGMFVNFAVVLEPMLVIVVFSLLVGQHLQTPL